MMLSLKYIFVLVLVTNLMACRDHKDAGNVIFDTGADYLSVDAQWAVLQWIDGKKDLIASSISNDPVNLYSPLFGRFYLSDKHDLLGLILLDPPSRDPGPLFYLLPATEKSSFIFLGVRFEVGDQDCKLKISVDGSVFVEGLISDLSGARDIITAIPLIDVDSTVEVLCSSTNASYEKSRVLQIAAANEPVNAIHALVNLAVVAGSSGFSITSSGDDSEWERSYANEEHLFARGCSSIKLANNSFVRVANATGETHWTNSFHCAIDDCGRRHDAILYAVQVDHASVFFVNVTK
jgi:hypothetical protein